MREDHKQVLKKAARKFACEIVVRESNEHSCQYIGRNGYKPKPIWCKAKTANRSGHKSARLVVNPFKVREAFLRKNRWKAEVEWRKFERQVLQQRLGFMVCDIPDNGRYGCVLHHGNYLYSDYDLMSVTPLSGGQPVVKTIPPEEGKHLSNSIRTMAYTDHTTDLEREINIFFRQRTGIAMIQHGAEQNLEDHEPTPQTCYVIRPDGCSSEVRPR